MKQLITLVFLVLSVISCRHGVYSELDLAESLLWSKPDSALLHLKSVNPDQLRTRRATARYALLMSAALDKNYIDVTSDSLIKKAVDYYSWKGDTRNKMLSWYYEGIVLKNGGQYPAAIVALEKAEKEASVIGDNYQLGLIFRNKASIFSHTYNDQEAIVCRKKSIDFFNKADADVYKVAEELSLAIDYSNSTYFEAADSLLFLILAQCSNPDWVAICHLTHAGILTKTNSGNREALNYYHQTPFKYYRNLDFARLALTHERLHERDSANFWLATAYSFCKNATDSVSVDYIRSQILHRRGNYEQAYQLIEKVLAAEDSLTRVQLFQSVSGAQRDYYKSESARREEQLKSARRERILGLVIGLLIALMGIVVFIGHSREKDRQLQEQLTRLALQEKELVRTSKTNAHLLGSLFSARIEHLDQLSRAYFKAEDKQEKDALFKQIKQCTGSLRNNHELFSSLEDDLNRYCNGIVSKLRTQVPRIKGDNLRIIMLFFAGFPYEVVQLIMNSTSTGSLKMTRHRFRNEIRAAQAPDEAFFLEMLEMKKRPQDNTIESEEGC